MKSTTCFSISPLLCTDASWLIVAYLELKINWKTINLLTRQYFHCWKRRESREKFQIPKERRVWSDKAKQRRHIVLTHVVAPPTSQQREQINDRAFDVCLIHGKFVMIRNCVVSYNGESRVYWFVNQLITRDTRSSCVLLFIRLSMTSTTIEVDKKFSFLHKNPLIGTKKDLSEPR